VAVIYKIRNPKGLYSNGKGYFTKHGKTWSTRNALRQHLGCASQPFYEGSVIVEVDVDTGITSEYPAVEVLDEVKALKKQNREKRDLESLRRELEYAKCSVKSAQKRVEDLERRLENDKSSVA